MSTYVFKEEIKTSKTRTMHTLVDNVNYNTYKVIRDMTEQMFGKRRKYMACGGKNELGKMSYMYQYNMTDMEYMRLCEQYRKVYEV